MMVEEGQELKLIRIYEKHRRLINKLGTREETQADIVGRAIEDLAHKNKVQFD